MVRGPMSAQSVVRGLVTAPNLQCIRGPTQVRKRITVPSVGKASGAVYFFLCMKEPTWEKDLTSA